MMHGSCRWLACKPQNGGLTGRQQGAAAQVPAGLLPQLLEPVGEFLSGGGWRANPNWQPHSPRGGVAAEFGIRSPEQRPHAPALAACTLDSSFGELLCLLVDRGLHRVFIVDGEGCPAGVVSTTDILRLLISGDAPCRPEP